MCVWGGGRGTCTRTYMYISELRKTERKCIQMLFTMTSRWWNNWVVLLYSVFFKNSPNFLQKWCKFCNKKMVFRIKFQTFEKMGLSKISQECVIKLQNLKGCSGDQ